MIPLGVLASSYVAPAGGGGISVSVVHSEGYQGTTGVRTYSGVSFGSADPSRILVAVLTGRIGGVTAVSIGGVTATIDLNFSNGSGVAIARAAVPSGTAGDVVVDASATDQVLVLFSLTGASSVGVSDTGSGATSATVTVPSGGVVFAGSFALYPPHTVSWTGTSGSTLVVSLPPTSSRSARSGTADYLLGGSGEIVTAPNWSSGSYIATAAVAYSVT